MIRTGTLFGVGWLAWRYAGLPWQAAGLLALALLTPSTGFIMDSLSRLGDQAHDAVIGLLATLGIVLGMLAAYAINLALMNMYELPRMPLHYLPLGALLLWVLGQIAVFGPARRAAAVPPAVATRGA